MIKILMIGNDTSVKGGITSVITQILDHNWKEDEINLNFIPTYVETNMIKKILFFIQAYSKIKKEIRQNKPDIAYIHMSYKGSFVRKNLIHELCKKNKIKTIIHLHGSEFKKWYDLCNIRKQQKIKQMLAECDAFIVLGEKWNKTIKNIQPKTNTIIINNTVSIPKITAKWHQPFKFLFLGKLIERKGVADLLKAIKILKEKDKLDNLKFIIAGTGEEENKLKNMCNEFEIEDYIKFTGWINGDDKAILMAECQALTLPSYNEGLPMAILEAMSYGMPIIATDVGDISSAVIDKENGFLIEPGDSENIAFSISKVSENKEAWSSFSKKSKEIAIEKFSDSKYFDKLKETFAEVLKED